jgi:hypothetical protein
MKEYLLVCGYYYLILIIIFLLLILFLNKNNAKKISSIIDFYYRNFNSWFFAITIVWNIIGSIIFWNQIYPKNICSTNVSTYLFVSLILKFIFYLLPLKIM